MNDISDQAMIRLRAEGADGWLREQTADFDRRMRDAYLHGQADGRFEASRGVLGRDEATNAMAPLAQATEQPTHPDDNAQVIRVGPVGQNARTVYFDRGTGIVTAGCFTGDLAQFREKIDADYGRRLKQAIGRDLGLERAGDVIRWWDEYSATYQHFANIYQLTHGLTKAGLAPEQDATTPA